MGKQIMIGDLARATGTKVNTIRFYEESGVMRRPARTGSGRRIYEHGDLQRLRFIRHGRDLGFGLPAIKSLLALAGDPQEDCGEVARIAAEHLRTVDRKIVHLQRLREELGRTIEACGGGTTSNCRILDVLSDCGGTGEEMRASIRAPQVSDDLIEVA